MYTIAIYHYIEKDPITRKRSTLDIWFSDIDIAVSQTEQHLAFAGQLLIHNFSGIRPDLGKLAADNFVKEST
jgi:hypothetical protein